MNNIFDLLNYKDNDSFSDIRGRDLKYLIDLLNSFSLVYRDTLFFSKELSFGVEIEVEDVSNYLELKNIILNSEQYNAWNVMKDGSLLNGAEIISPILYNDIDCWKQLDSVCDLIRNYARINVNCGGHIHVGSNILGSINDNWINFLKLWATYENIIYRFTYNDYLGARPVILNYSKPASGIIKSRFSRLDDINNCDLSKLIKNFCFSRIYGINLKRVDANNLDKVVKFNTIEFRCPNGTINPVIWQNNVNLFVNLLNSVKNNEINFNIVDERYNTNNNLGIYDDINYYGYIYLDQVLEFVDLIFNNNYDKVYFLKQYLKNLDEYDKNKYVKCKKFTL